MDIQKLSQAVCEIKRDMEDAVQTAECLGKSYGNGQKAKEALIRSQRLIMKIHEVVKSSLVSTLQTKGITHTIHPPLGESSPELKITGFIKAKNQDVVVLFDGKTPEIISEGPLEGNTDYVGKNVSETSIVIGVRSQMSSVAKNFDTLMERAFAETLNLRLRLPSLVMGEVYLLPIVEYDNVAMEDNRVVFKDTFVPVERFIKTFLGITGRNNNNLESSFYKYDRSCLVLADFRSDTPRVFTSLQELKEKGVVSEHFDANFYELSPQGFCQDIVDEYIHRHHPQ